MSMPVAPTDSAPMAEINTTPLIDVMLVLLIMFVITIPLQTHAVKLDLPAECAACPEVNPVSNRLVVTDTGAILWNGQPISRDGLLYNLAVTRRMSRSPELHLQPNPEAPYRVVDEVLAITKRAGIRNMGFVGNERYRDF